MIRCKAFLSFYAFRSSARRFLEGEFCMCFICLCLRV